jgi:hypothetical protein
MQNTSIQKKTQVAAITTAAVLYFVALVLFSLWFTQN